VYGGYGDGNHGRTHSVAGSAPLQYGHSVTLGANTLPHFGHTHPSCI
jgi:hypothetical protein